MQEETKEKMTFKVLYILPEDLEPFREYAKANGRTMTQQFHVEVLKLAGSKSQQRRIAMQTGNDNARGENNLSR